MTLNFFFVLLFFFLILFCSTKKFWRICLIFSSFSYYLLFIFLVCFGIFLGLVCGHFIFLKPILEFTQKVGDLFV